MERLGTMFNLHFDMGNDHFNHDAVPQACAEILKKVAINLDNGVTYGTIVDDNGNKIGYYKTSEE